MLEALKLSNGKYKDFWRILNNTEAAGASIKLGSVSSASRRITLREFAKYLLAARTIAKGKKE